MFLKGDGDRPSYEGCMSAKDVVTAMPAAELKFMQEFALDRTAVCRVSSSRLLVRFKQDMESFCKEDQEVCKILVVNVMVQHDYLAT